jgi:hypothetical protein
VAGPSKADWTFVEKYAVADRPTRKKLEALGRKCLQRIQYKLKNPKLAAKSPTKKSSDLLDIPHDLSGVWYELVFLCQCEGSLQTDSLNTLTTSLGSAPVSSAQIPCLLYIATLGYRWLKSDDIGEEFLKSEEVVILRVIYLVSLRLFCHVLTGSLKDLLSTQEGEYFKTDFDGFHMREQLYEKCPVSHFYWRIVLHVGEMICHMISGDTVPSWTESSSMSGHTLPPFLWHSLDLLKSSKQSNAQLESSVVDLLKCSPQPHREQVVEGVLALGVMFSVAKGSSDVLSVLQVVAQGVNDVIQGRFPFKHSMNDSSDVINIDRPPGEGSRSEEGSIFNRGHVNILGQQVDFKTSGSFTVSSSSYTEEKPDNRFPSPSETLSGVGKSPTLSADGVDITLNVSDTSSHSADRSEQPRIGKGKTVESSMKCRKSSHLSAQHEDFMSSIRDLTSVRHMGHRKSVSISLPEHYTDITSQYAVSEAPLEDGAVFLGSIAPSTLFHRSLLSTPNTFQDAVFDDEDGTNTCGNFREFPWEMTVAYCTHMTSVIISGLSSKIQLQALEGYRIPVVISELEEKATLHMDSKKVYGLMQLARFSEKLLMEQYNGSWKVRYAAIRGLSAVCHVCKSQVVKDGFSDVAWERILKLHSEEKDRKVFEAFKMQMREPAVLEEQYSLSIFDVLGTHLINFFLPTPSPQPTNQAVQITSPSGKQDIFQHPKHRPSKKAVVEEGAQQRQWTEVKPKVSTYWDGKFQKPRSSRASNTRTLHAIAETHWQQWLKEEQNQDASPRKTP